MNPHHSRSVPFQNARPVRLPRALPRLLELQSLRTAHRGEVADELEEHVEVNRLRQIRVEVGNHLAS